MFQILLPKTGLESSHNTHQSSSKRKSVTYSDPFSTRQSQENKQNTTNSSKPKATTQSFYNSSKNDPIDASSSYQNRLIQSKRPLSRSKTENSIMSLGDSLGDSSHSTNLSREPNSDGRKRYSLEFLLSRSDTPLAQKMPPDWHQLNEKYPTICFSGKILQYFNPKKYHNHWNKVKLQNIELHSSSSNFGYMNKGKFRRLFM